MNVQCGAVAIEVTPLTAAIVRWLLDHQADLDARDAGTITVNYSQGKGTVEIAHLGRDSVQFVAQPRR